MLGSFFRKLPVIKQIRGFLWKRKFMNDLRAGAERIVDELPQVKTMKSVRELGQFVTVSLVEMGDLGGNPTIYAYACSICNSKFESPEGDEGLRQHLGVVHLITIEGR